MTVTLVVLLLAASAQAQWKPPADKKFTEDRLIVFLDTQKEWLAENSKILQQISTSQTDAEKLAAVGDLDTKYQACLQRHQISREEYEWLGRQALAAWTSLTYFDKAYKNAGGEIETQTKQNAAKLADAQARLAIYQKAQTDGVRVMTSSDRDEAINSATIDQKSALEEAKQHADDAASAKTEAKQHDDDAKTADDLAANPPSDISADDRSNYIASKKTEADTARDAAKDAHDRADYATQAQADAQARAAVDAQKIAHPEVPISDDDKASVKSENEEAIASAQSDIAECAQQSTQIAAASQQLKISSQLMTQDIPQENITIMRKYADRYHDQLTQAFAADAATQPAP